MKKIFTLFAAAVMAMSAYADVVKIEVNPTKINGAIAAGTELFSNDDISIKTVYATTGTNNTYDYEDGDIAFNGCVNVRSKRPTESDVIGEVDGTNTPLILTVSKGMIISGYVRTGDNKKLSLYKQNPFEEITPDPADGETDSRTGSDTRWVFTWKITPGVYTLTEIGGGGRLSGFTYELTGDDDTTAIEEIAVDENAPVEYFNLQGIRVENPENGLYIRRQGNKVIKVVL